MDIPGFRPLEAGQQSASASPSEAVSFSPLGEGVEALGQGGQHGAGAESGAVGKSALAQLKDIKATVTEARDEALGLAHAIDIDSLRENGFGDVAKRERIKSLFKECEPLVLKATHLLNALKHEESLRVSELRHVRTAQATTSKLLQQGPGGKGLRVAPDHGADTMSLLDAAASGAMTRAHEAMQIVDELNMMATQMLMASTNVAARLNAPQD